MGSPRRILLISKSSTNLDLAVNSVSPIRIRGGQRPVYHLMLLVDLERNAAGTPHAAQWIEKEEVLREIYEKRS